MDGGALSPVIVDYSFSEAFDCLSCNNTCFFFEFAKNRVFFAFIWFDVAFYEVPVSSLVLKKEVDDFGVFHEDDGAA